MNYRIEYADEQCCNIAHSRKVYRSGAVMKKNERHSGR